MTTHVVTLNYGMEARITIDPGSETMSAYGLLFDADARTLSETMPTRYSGYCTPCILADVTAHLLRLADSNDRTTAGEVEHLFADCLC